MSIDMEDIMSGNVKFESDNLPCGNHRPVRCAWCPSHYQIWGRKSNGHSCCHAGLYPSVKAAEAEVLKMDGPEAFAKYLATKKAWNKAAREAKAARR